MIVLPQSWMGRIAALPYSSQFPDFRRKSPLDVGHLQWCDVANLQCEITCLRGVWPSEREFEGWRLAKRSAATKMGWLEIDRVFKIHSTYGPCRWAAPFHFWHLNIYEVYINTYGELIYFFHLLVVIWEFEWSFPFKDTHHKYFIYASVPLTYKNL